MRIRVSVLVVAAILMAGCATSPGSPGLRDEDIQKIRALQSRFIAVCQRSAWAELPPFFTDDAALIHAHEPAVQGIDAIREHYHALQLRALEAHAQPTVIEGSGSWAYLRGTTSGLFQVGAAEPVQDRGAFI